MIKKKVSKHQKTKNFLLYNNFQKLLIESNILLTNIQKNINQEFSSSFSFFIQNKKTGFFCFEKFSFLYKFRNIYPIINQIFMKKQKILIIGNNEKVSNLLDIFFFKKYLKNILIFNKSWIDGFISSKGEYTIFRYEMDKYFKTPCLEQRVLYKTSLSNVGLIIILNEIEDKRTIEILKSSFLRKIPTIYLHDSFIQKKNQIFSMYPLIINAKELDSFFLFLSFFLKKTIFKPISNEKIPTKI